MLKEDALHELCKRVKQGEIEAFHTLYSEYFAQLCTFAERFVYDYQEAEDLVQDSFFALWSNLDSYNPERSVVAYLMQIVKNNCYNYLHSLKIHDEHKDKIIEALLFSNLQEHELDEDIRLRLRQVLSQLPDRGRTILLEHILEKKKIKTIAHEMGIAESTVKTHLKRVLQTLRSQLCYILIGI